MAAPLVLIAEDYDVNRLVVAHLLERRGVDAEHARTGREAVQMAAEREYAAIFMDCYMPDLDGYEATKCIRATESDRHIPIVALTASPMPEDRERCLEVGMDDFLAKPIDTGELDQILDRWVFARGGERPVAAGFASPAAVDEPSGAPLDPVILGRLVADYEPAQLERLLATFELSLRQGLVSLNAAIARGDQLDMDRILHRLAGSSAAFGARRLSDALQALRLQVGVDRDDLVRRASQLEMIAAHARAQLRAGLLAGGGDAGAA